MEERKSREIKMAWYPPLLSSLAPSLREFSDKIPSKQHGVYIRGKYSLIDAGGSQYFCIGDKPAGIEPGFMAIKFDYEFAQAIRSNLSVMTRFKILPKGFVTEGMDDDALLAKILKEINGSSAFAEMLGDFIYITSPLAKEKNDQIVLAKPFTLWMFKQDYNDPDASDKVEIPPKRYISLKRSQEKSRPKLKRIKANLNAIREAIANDLSYYFGVPTQEQLLKVGEYNNGALKFYTVCRFENGYQDLGEFYKLAGDVHKPTEKKGLFQNYLYERHKPKGAKSIHIPNIGLLLALQLLMEERDFIGAYGQNLGIVDGHIFVVDLGKAFQSTRFTRVLDSLQANGFFGQPLSWLPVDWIRRHVLYRNTTILFDAPYEEIITGMHMLNKLIYGLEPSEGIADSYGDNFKKLTSQTEQGGLIKVLNDHFENLENLKKSCPQEQHAEIDMYIAELAKTKAVVEANAAKILAVFKERLHLPANQVELLSNLEKLTSGVVFDQTNDGKRRISHLQVDMPTRVHWEINRFEKDNRYHLYFDSSRGSANTLMKLKKFLTDPRITSLIEEKMADRGMELEHNLKLKGLVYTVETMSAAVTRLSFEKKYFEVLCEVVTETNVHQHRIPLAFTDIACEKTAETLAEYYKEKFQDRFSFFGLLTSSKEEERIRHFIAAFNTSGKSKYASIMQLILTLGLLSRESSRELKSLVLKNLKCDSHAMAVSRMKMLLRDEIVKIYPEASTESIIDFINQAGREMHSFEIKAVSQGRYQLGVEDLMQDLAINIAAHFPPEPEVTLAS